MPDLIADRAIEIVLTGGACGGKTTALTALAHLLRTRGQHVVTVPEAFTMIVSRGVSGVGEMVRADGIANCDFQRTLFTNIRDIRAHTRSAVAQLHHTTVILYDRAELDALAFHDHSCFDDLSAEYDTTMTAIRDSYDAVMHLVTTADGAESFYTQMTNDARWESVDEAKASDGRLFEAWSQHPRHVRIDNSTDFDGKLARLLEATLQVIADAETTVEVPGVELGVTPQVAVR